MRLFITDPVTIAVDADDVVSVRAEDASGSFGILSGHADFLTSLSISVVIWRHADGRPGFCAVRNGILTVSGGHEVSIATREAHVGDDLDTLETVVLAGYRAHAEGERAERSASAKLRIQAIRYMVEALGGAPRTIGL
jgi:F-type H+-transporting ATPase subunit epsilon